jgi:hypothetical protein
VGAREREFKPPFCPNPACEKHLDPRSWGFKKIGFYCRRAAPRRIQGFLCGHCRRSFSSQTFSTSYWLKRPDLLVTLFWRTLGCYERHRPRGALSEPLVVDGFGSFEYSQYHPFHFKSGHRATSSTGSPTLHCGAAGACAPTRSARVLEAAPERGSRPAMAAPTPGRSSARDTVFGAQL